jgi:hypothetical protein
MRVNVCQVLYLSAVSSDNVQHHEKKPADKLAFLCAGEIAFGLAAVTAAATTKTTTAAATA